MTSLTYAEVVEHAVQNIVRRDDPEDLLERALGTLEVRRRHLGRYAPRQRFPEALNLVAGLPQQIGLASAGHHRHLVAVVDDAPKGVFSELALQLTQTFAGLHRNGHLAILGDFVAPGKVPFRAHAHHRSRQALQKAALPTRGGVTRLAAVEHQVGPGQVTARHLDSQLLHALRGTTQPCRVH